MARSVTRVRLAFSAAIVVAGASLPVHAADLDRLGAYRTSPTDGVPCEAPEVQTFRSVWLGHFTGGYSHYLGPGESIVLDWRDEKLCFPSRGTCNRHVAVMRRDFHRPEGYFTCLPIR